MKLATNRKHTILGDFVISCSGDTECSSVGMLVSSWYKRNEQMTQVLTYKSNRMLVVNIKRDSQYARDSITASTAMGI